MGKSHASTASGNLHPAAMSESLGVLHRAVSRRFAGGMAGPAHEVLNDVVLNQVVVAFGDARRTDAVIAAVQDDGTCWCGPTTWRGREAMRVSVSGWNTTEDDIDKSVAAVLACARRSASR